MLTLPIKKKWFDMILSGEKKEEYREIKPYYTKRFDWTDDNVLNIHTQLMSRTIQLRNGYSKNSPAVVCHVVIYKGYGKTEWGAEPNKLYYVLKILKVERMKYYEYT